MKLKKISQEIEQKTASGIITAVKTIDNIKREQRATQEAYVVELGPTAFKAFDDGNDWCAKGDCVLISKYSGDDLDDVEDGEIYRIINDRDIEAVFPEDGLKHG